MNGRQSQILGKYLGYIGIALMVLGGYFSESIVYAGTGCLTLGVVLMAVFSKCPHCLHRIPDLRLKKGSRCPFCGKEIDSRR